MRSFSLALIVLFTLGAVSASAGQFAREREARRTVDRVIRVVKSILRMRTNGDGLMPPLPAPAPPKAQ